MIEIRGFDVALRIDDQTFSNPMECLLEGLGVFDCRKILVYGYQGGTLTPRVGILKSWLRGDSRSLPNLPLIMVQVGIGGSAGSITLVLADCDIRPGMEDPISGLGLASSAIVGEADRGSWMRIVLQNTALRGRPDPVFGDPAGDIQKAGLEAVFVGGSRGRVDVWGSKVSDCKGEGLFLIASGLGSDPAFDMQDSLIEDCGWSATTLTPTSNAAPPWAMLTGSGVHAGIREGDAWRPFNIQNSTIQNSGTHGVFLEGASTPDLPGGFPDVNFVDSTILNSGNVLAQQNDAHGFFASLADSSLGFSAERTLFNQSRTSGIRIDFLTPHQGLQTLQLQDCAVAENLVSSPTANFEFYAPITVLSNDPSDRLQVNLTNNTIAYNQSCYGLSLIPNNYPQGNTGRNLWEPGSSVENTVVRMNTNASNPGKSQAYFPEPPPVPTGTSLWESMFNSTSFSDLDSLNAPMWAYSLVRGNFYDDPLLLPSPWGRIMPSTLAGSMSPLIDRGNDNPTFPAGLLDVRRKDRKVDYPSVSGSSLIDVGAVEVQEDE